MSKRFINPSSLFNSKQYGFSQAIVAPAGGQMVFISGQIAYDENERLVGGSDLKAQTRQVLKNLQIAIRSAGGELSNIVMLRIYIVQPSPDDITTVGEALRECFGVAKPPASTWLGVTSLAREEFAIEIEATAVI